MAQPERKSMDAAILVNSISDILKCSLAPPATRLSAKDLQQFQNHLEGIRDMVQKANNNINSQDSDVLAWLHKVKEVVNDLEDLIEVLPHKGSATANASRSLIKASQNMAHRLKVTHHVKKAAEELKRFLTEAPNLSFSKEARNSERKLSDTATKFENTLVAFGRENAKKEIINQLKQFVNSGGDSVVSVVFIVGVPGIGKTKLARLVYEDEQVKAHFGEQIWVHGNRETLDATRVAGAVKKGIRFLLVLDDLRDDNVEECLHKLQQRLTEACGAVVITTRSNFVVNYKIPGTVKLYALQGLNQEESWSLFQQIREQGSSNYVNESVEREIVKEYCGGVPMKIITIARLLNSSESQLSEADFKKEFLQELKFTYYHQLPLHQKLCFVYCSLFPQDYVIDGEKLIHLWMAEGFLSRNLCSDPQEFGSACFNDFVPFVFEETGRDEFGVVKSYKMNRLMHELARIVAWDENIVVDSDGKRVHGRVVRASFDFALDVQCGIPEALFEKAKKLRTILLLGKTNKSRLPHEVKMATSTCDKILDTFKCFRVLDLHDLGIKMLPRSIGELKHLRYLDLSHNNIEKLPSSITKLVHLQTLKLSQCHVLKELPKDLEDLSCLMHLCLEGCLDLTHMPRGIGKLSSLQTLSLFVASKNNHMGDLKDLNSLRGNLEILHLERLKLSASDAKDKYVRDKKHLNCLTLRWDQEEEEEEDEEEEKDKGNDVDHKDRKSLECLEPNPNLKVLCVVGYYGNMFSDWLSKMQCLVKFSLNDCPKCQFIPPLDHLQHLRVLELRRLDSLEFISADAEGSSSPTFFPSLKELTISDCPNLRSWWKTEKWEDDRPFFNCICKLHVQCCPNLHCLPLYPFLDEELVLVDSSVKSMRDTVHAKTSKDFLPLSKLKSMVIERITQSPPKSWLKNFISLENLLIRDCSKFEYLPEGFKSLSSLQRLTIEGCPELDLDVSKAEWEGLKHLRCLTIREIPKLKSLPWGVEDVTSLEELELYECPALTFLPESMAKLTSLRKLVISECKSLGSLPKGLEMLESLNTLTITDCPLLLPRCQPETGDDWPQIGHVRNILLKQNSQALRDLWSQGRTG